MSLLVKLLAQRIALGLLLLFLVSILIFAGTIILPGDVAQQILGQSATPEALANMRRDLGLNDPPIQRYFSWLGGLVQGDLGTSLTSGKDIAESISKRLGNTLFLAFWASPGLSWSLLVLFWGFLEPLEACEGAFLEDDRSWITFWALL
ncbi:MAG: ABC transporter permease, partial [Pseudomonadota bacterium]|nr:ABC transporter permease [Pseudomonadota bacterium]